jgi:L-fuconolactonase
MVSQNIDIHPHVIANDDKAYPRDPLFGKQSDWSRDRPVTIEQLVAAMDEAGVQKEAIVQASTCYGFDNSYVTDSIAKYPGRFTAVGSIDMLAPDAVETAKSWMKRGVSGFRLFTGGSTAAFDTSALDDRRSFPMWEFCGENGVSICLQTSAVGLAQAAGLAKRFPKVKIILDHLARADLSDGPPYSKAVSLFAMSAFENIYLKITPRIFEEMQEGKASVVTFIPKLINAFGASRIAWGSNFPASAGKLSDNLAIARDCLSVLSPDEQAWIFARTAQKLYPALAD